MNPNEINFDINSVSSSTFQGLPQPTPNCPNPLFLTWVAEWYQSAKQKQSQTKYNFKKAYQSILQYPVVLLPHETIKLNGIGETTMNRLQLKYNQYLKEHGITPTQPDPSSQAPSQDPSPSQSQSQSQSQDPKPKRKRTKPKKEYIPAYRSAPYAILLALRIQLNNQTNFEQHYTSKSDLIDLAQPYSLNPMDRPLPGQRYTGWSSMKTLIAKELVETRGHPPMYGLTDQGVELGDKIYQLHCQNQNIDYISLKLNSIETEHNGNNWQYSGPIDLKLEGYKILLVIDSREINSKNTEEFFRKQCERLNIEFCFRQLSVGDFLWIAQPDHCGGPEEEIVLDYVIERKALDDLVSSIKDGRYREQKSRLRDCGAPKVIYLIENFTQQEALKTGMPVASIWASIVHTQLLNNFTIKQTEDITATLKYAAFVTKMLKLQYEGKYITFDNDPKLTKAQYKEKITDNPNIKISFQLFQSMNSKTQPMTISDMFVKMLSCTSGVSVVKALEIVKNYPTPLSLYNAYKLESDPINRERLLATKNILPNRRISNNLSKKILQEWFGSHEH